jgi:asparagine synthase (glutamine-hydrolysing)
LINKGHKTRTGSDIEIAIHAYEEWGPECVKKFRGMFALALYDKNKSKVYLYRDRMGEKPLYYTLIKDNIYFASELKALVGVPGFNKEINKNAIDLFFHYYFIPEPDTPFTAVNKLKTGHFLEIDLETGKFGETSYWDPLAIVPKSKTNPTNEIRKTFAESCNLTLRSDVPVGISLSGGVDSGSILAFSAPNYKSVMNAFSIGYEGTPATDERKLAKSLADKFGVNFIEKEIKVSEIINHFPYLVWSGDDPIADIAAHSIYEVSKLARKHNVKVLLGGAGGDELYWGYPSTIEAAKKNTAKKSVLDKIFNPGFYYNNPNPKNAGLFIRELYSLKFKGSVNRNNYKLPLKAFTKSKKINGSKRTMDSVRDLWLKSDVITLGDRMSMASGVELRAPFLDYKLAEQAYGSQKNVESWKISEKYYFKNAMKGILPDEIMNRPKQGFTPPVAKWISVLTKKYSKLLINGFLVNYDIFDKNKLSLTSSIFQKIPSYTFYQILVMEIWGREYVMGQKPGDLLK